MHRYIAHSVNTETVADNSQQYIQLEKLLNSQTWVNNWILREKEIAVMYKWQQEAIQVKEHESVNIPLKFVVKQ